MVNPEYYFRLIGLNDEELGRIEKLFLKDVPYRTGREFRDQNKRVLTIGLGGESVSAELLKSIVECASEVRFDFFISIYASEESFLVDLPLHVVKCIREVGGEVCFSYTYRPEGL